MSVILDSAHRCSACHCRSAHLPLFDSLLTIL
jgi:hypothetical protein